MSVGRELRERQARRDPFPPEEQEVDVRGLGAAIAARWWLPLVGILAGIAVGYVLSLGGTTLYRAEALLYLGQPFTPSGGGQIGPSLQSNPSIVSEIVRSEAALRQAARRSGLRVGQLRGNVSSRPAEVSATFRRQAATTTLIVVSVQGPAPGKVERAATALAGRVVAATSPYVNDKIRGIRERVRANRRNLAEVEARLTTAQRLQTEVLGNRSLGEVERLLLVTNLQSQISFAEQRRAAIEDILLNASQQLSLAENVERSQVVNEAVATKTSARNARTSVLVGAAIGLILGLLAALLWEPLAARRSGR